MDPPKSLFPPRPDIAAPFFNRRFFSPPTLSTTAWRNKPGGLEQPPSLTMGSHQATLEEDVCVQRSDLFKSHWLNQWLTLVTVRTDSAVRAFVSGPRRRPASHGHGGRHPEPGSKRLGGCFRLGTACVVPLVGNTSASLQPNENPTRHRCFWQFRSKLPLAGLVTCENAYKGSKQITTSAASVAAASCESAWHFNPCLRVSGFQPRRSSRGVAWHTELDFCPFCKEDRLTESASETNFLNRGQLARARGRCTSAVSFQAWQGQSQAFAADPNP